MVSGVFDGLHPGHRNFLLEAAQSCNTLVVVVARASIVQRLKGHAPQHSTRDAGHSELPHMSPHRLERRTLATRETAIVFAEILEVARKHSL